MTINARCAASVALFFSTLSVLLLTAGCGGEKKMEPVKPGEMDTYRDPGFGYSIQYPRGWMTNAEVGRAGFYSAQEVDKKFLDPTGQFPDGVMIGVTVIRSSNPDTAKKIIDEMIKSGFIVTKPETLSVGGRPGTRYGYTGLYTKTVKETGQHIYVPSDTVLYDIRCAGFGGYFDAYRAVFDASFATFQLPKAAVPGRDPTLPSETPADASGQLFSFQYPDNFNGISVPKGTNEEVIELRGVRQDCSIRVDVFGAKGLTVEKVFDQNKGKYKATATARTTVSGLPAMSLTYAATPNVERRFYFIVKNDKVFRVTMDWYRPQREEYLKAYDRTINSLKIK
jgi:hypothetical protein